MLENFSLDRLSFWLGFTAGVIFWLLIVRINRRLPQVKTFLEKNKTKQKRQKYTVSDTLWRQETYRRAQRAHLAGAMFPLDQIIIKPNLCNPPISPNPEGLFGADAYRSQVLLFTPGDSDFSSYFGYPHTNAIEAAENCDRIALIGDSGSGKSVALAYLATHYAKFDMSSQSKSLPVYLHLFDLDWEPGQKTSFKAALFNQQLSTLPINSQSHFLEYLEECFNQNRVLLLIDGLDEMSETESSPYWTGIEALIKEYPTLRLILTASKAQLSAPIRNKFHIFHLAGWSADQSRTFVKHWISIWEKQILPSLPKNLRLNRLDGKILEEWVVKHNGFLTPLEWTLRVWAAVSGDLAGNTSIHAIQAFLDRTLTGNIPDADLANLAQEFFKNNKAKLKKFITRLCNIHS